MSYHKLYELLNIGLKTASIRKLSEKFQNLGKNSIITYDDIKKAIFQKMLVDNVIDFLVENKIIKPIEDEENSFKILVEFPSTITEKESKEYIENKIFNSTKKILIDKILSYYKQDKEGYILFLDLANSTDKFGGDLLLRSKILNEDFPKVIKETEKEFFNLKKGYLISQKGDEAHLFFFEKEFVENFIKKFINNYTNELFEKIEEYNQSRKINNPFTDKMYLKIFLFHSKVKQPNYTIDTMPNFNDMDAFTYIARVEKKFKEVLVEKYKEIDIKKYFLVSQDSFKGCSEIDISHQDGVIKVSYYIE